MAAKLVIISEESVGQRDSSVAQFTLSTAAGRFDMPFDLAQDTLSKRWLGHCEAPTRS